MQSCVEKLLIQILQTNPNALTEQELEQLKLTGRFAVMRESIAARQKVTVIVGNITRANVSNVESVGNVGSVGDVETPRDVSVRNILNESPPEDAVIFLESKELAR